MTEDQVRLLRKGDRVYSERFAGGRVKEVWALSLDVFVDFDDGGACYYPRREHHLLEREETVLARRQPPGRLRPSGLALKLGSA
jgi:hypothetical protein